MIRKRKGLIEWFEFSLFQDFPSVQHGVLLSHGGVSQGIYRSLNLGKSTQDSKGCVQENYERARAVFELPVLVRAGLEHKTKLSEVVGNEGDWFGEFSDGLWTCKEDVGIMSTHADCQVALFFSPQKRLVAVLHCGWRGNRANFYGQAVQQLQKEKGVSPRDLLVAVGPSLGPVHAEFINYESEWPREFWDFKVGKNHFHLWEMSRAQLQDAGVCAENIEIAGLCTYESKMDLFSYRRQRVTGRNGSFIALRGLS